MIIPIMKMRTIVVVISSIIIIVVVVVNVVLRVVEVNSFSIVVSSSSSCLSMMACSGYCKRCQTIHTLPTTPGAIKAVTLLRHQILSHANQNQNNTDNNDICLPDRWWINDDENENENDAVNDAVNNAVTDVNEQQYSSTREKNNKKIEKSSSLRLNSTTTTTTNSSSTNSSTTNTTTTNTNTNNKLFTSLSKRGKMIGVLECISIDTNNESNNSNNEIIYLAGYAGKLGTKWSQTGFVPPIVIPENVSEFIENGQYVTNLTNQIEKHIESSDNNNNSNSSSSSLISTLQSQRKQYATKGLRSLQNAQLIYNFRKEDESSPKSIPNVYYKYPSNPDSNTNNNVNNKKQQRLDRRTKNNNRKSQRRQLWKQQQQQQQSQQQQQQQQQQQYGIIDDDQKQISDGKTADDDELSTSTSIEEEEEEEESSTATISSSRSLHRRHNNNRMPPIVKQQNNEQNKNRNKLSLALLPGGVGDCAAPKLLNAIHTNTNNTNTTLIPIGIAEIFIGTTGGMSTTKYDNGTIYDSCLNRCQPIMGYMLCGLEELIIDATAK